jgi:hypothetical protein
VSASPAGTEHQWWGTVRTPALDELINIFHEALFAEDDTGGPYLRFAETVISTDDDGLVGLMADQAAFAILDRGDEVIALINKVRADYAAVEEMS